MGSAGAGFTSLAPTRLPGASGTTSGWWAAGHTRYAAGVGRVALRPTSPTLRNDVVVLRSETGEVTLHPSQPLNGRGLIVVQGNLVVESGNVSRLKGVVYVTGDVTIGGDFQLQGMLIVKGACSLGTGVDSVVIQYDPNEVQLLKRALERYRMSRSIRPGWSRLVP